MKVSHIIYLSQKPGSNPFSGAEKHIVILVEGLRKAGVDVELIVLLWNPGKLIDETLDRLSGNGVKITLLKRAPQGMLKNRLTRALACWFRLARLLRKRRDRIIHIHLDLYAVMIAAVVAGCRKIVVSIHNDERYFFHLFFRLWFRTIDTFVSAYIGITETVRKYYLAASGVDAEKMTTVYYGVPELAPEPVARARQELKIPGDRFIVGFVGRLTPQKNLRVFIEALSGLPDICGVIIGQGEQREELEDLVQKLGASNIMFLGAIPNADQIMPLFDVFCLPSEWEGLGLVLLEAMQRRVPIIGSRAGAIPEILGGGEYGLLFDFDNVLELRKQIEYAKDNPDAMKAIADKAFSNVATSYSVETMVAETIAVYEKCNG